MKMEWQPTQEEKLLGALAHGSAIIPTWGLIVAVVVWISQREKSGFAELQARQAVTWQIAQLIFSFAVGIVAFVVAIVGAFSMAVISSPGGEPPLFFFAYFPIIGIALLSGFAFSIIAVWAAIRNLQGHSFIYPLLGPRVERYVRA